MLSNFKKQSENYGIPPFSASTEKWTISPVCSRLKEHIIMMNGNSFKERLFLQSPM